MKTLKFRHDLTLQILADTKTITWRLFDDKDLTLGDRLEFVDSELHEKFAEADITDLREKRMGDVTEADYIGHEAYVDKDAMMEHYRHIYGDRVNDDTMVKIITFRTISGDMAKAQF